MVKVNLIDPFLTKYLRVLWTDWCIRFVCDVCSSGHRRKLPRQREWRRRCKLLVQQDGSWWGSRDVPADDGRPAAWRGDSAGERRISDGHQQPAPNGPGEDVDGNQRHHQPGTNQHHCLSAGLLHHLSLFSCKNSLLAMKFLFSFIWLSIGKWWTVNFSHLAA